MPVKYGVATPPASLPLAKVPVPGRLLTVPTDTSATSTLALASLRLYACPFALAAPGTFTGATANVTTSSTNNIRIAIYAADPITGLPTVQLAVLGTFAVNAVSEPTFTFASAYRLNAGLYWLAVGSAVATASCTLTAVTGINVYTRLPTGTAPAASVTYTGWTYTLPAGGAWPADLRTLAAPTATVAARLALIAA